MNLQVKEKVEALAEALAASNEVKALKAAREELEQHEAAKIMLRDLQSKQRALQALLVQGQEPSQSEIEAYERAAQLAGFNPYVRKVIEAEMALGEVLVFIQQRLDEVIGVSRGSVEDGEEKPESSDESEARNRLWVPGDE